MFGPETEQVAATNKTCKITPWRHRPTGRLLVLCWFWPSPVGDADRRICDERRRIRRERRRGSDLQPKKTLLLLDLLSRDEPGASVDKRQYGYEPPTELVSTNNDVKAAWHNGAALLMRRRGNTSNVGTVINSHVIRNRRCLEKLSAFSLTARLFL